ncbi:MAG: hypothetical protein U0935_11325 [Pirellulales bacterium]
MPVVSTHLRDTAESRRFPVLFHLLGCVPYDRCAALQQKLVAAAQSSQSPATIVLLAEHPPEITVGRRGSRRHIRLPASDLASRGLLLRWAARGGGCVLHAPGQLAVYPIVPLAPRGWSLADFRRRLRQALVGTLEGCGYTVDTTLPGAGVWGRSGALAVSGIGEAAGVTHHGAWINVHPDRAEYGRIDVVPPDRVAPQVRTTMSSLQAEHRRPVRMTTVRAAVVEHLATALDCPAPHLSTGHPLL